MAPSALQQRRTHNTLLCQKLLNLREGASPFTLVLDTLEQSGGAVVREFGKRAKISKSRIVFISFSTLRKRVPVDIDIFVSASGKPLNTLRNDILSNLSPSTAVQPPSHVPKTLLIFDTLNPLASTHPTHLSPFLTSLLLSPSISIIATYHTDIPLRSPSPYHPDPLTTLTYLATAILAVSSLAHVLARKKARDRSLVEPVFGVEEQIEGVLFGLKSKSTEDAGVVITMELRRRSGRGIVENFVLQPTTTAPSSQPTPFILLDDHPLYATTLTIPASEARHTDDAAAHETTFSLGLTAKQQRDREGVVLPYFDAQREGGVGEGGRILYAMGAEDREDFDDEEDEI